MNMMIIDIFMRLLWIYRDDAVDDDGLLLVCVDLMFVIQSRISIVIAIWKNSWNVEKKQQNCIPLYVCNVHNYDDD